MEALYPNFYTTTFDDWFSQEIPNVNWTREENKKFESALAMYDEGTPDRWLKVAAMIPGKTVWDVIKQYRDLEDDVGDIEAGRVPIPGYLASNFGLELGNRGFDGERKRSGKGFEQERKKGVPWTEEEHRRFLMGLMKCGKGDWRNISRNFVVSKSPTQVASHAQKYFIRQLSGGKDKRRPSIHDITTLNLTNTTVSDNIIQQHPRPADQSYALLGMKQKCSSSSRPKVEVNWDQDHSDDDGGASAMIFNSTRGSRYLSSSYEIASERLKFPVSSALWQCSSWRSN